MGYESILKKYVCKNPFEYLDVQSRSSYICCPSWCSKDVMVDNGKLGWGGEEVKKIQKSVLNGSYEYCDKKVCPTLNKLINTGKPSPNFVPKDEFLKIYPINNLEDIDEIEFGCKEIVFGFDRSCNLKCPSCRDSIVTNDKIQSNAHKIKLDILEKIETKLGSTLTSILITGSGDPFYSNIYRDYLINFDKSKYPKLREIKIITNGLMLDEKMWNSLNAKKYIKHIEVSIDAGTKDTYENVTRLNGNWDRLIGNLHFISTLRSVNTFQLSFVVSEKNYTEMEKFYDIISNIFEGRSFEVVFRKQVYWGSGKYTKQEVEDISIFNQTHVNHDKFIEEFNKIYTKPNVNHNFHHLIKKTLL